MRLTRDQQQKQDAIDARLLAGWTPLLRRMVMMVREVASDLEEARRRMRDPARAERYFRNLGPLSWAHHYEHSFKWQFFHLLRLTGGWKFFRAFVQPGGAFRAIADFSAGKDHVRDDELSDSPKAIAAVFALVRNAECFAATGTTLNDLIARARNPDDRALREAIRYDPSVLMGRTAQRRIAKAATLIDRPFFEQLGTALLDIPAPAKYLELNLCLFLMLNAGQLDKLSRKATIELFKNQLRLYEGDPASLWTAVTRYKQKMATKPNADL